MKSIDKMTSAEAREALEATQTRLRELGERRAEIRGPSKQRGAPPDAGRTGWTPPDPLTGAGPAYQKAVDESDTAALLALKQELRELDAEREILHLRFYQLRDRVKAAAAEEAKAEAPAKAKRLMEELPGVYDRVDAALLELADALDAAGAHKRELKAARELTGGEPYFSPELLRRKWASRVPVSAHQLRGAISTRPDALEVMVPSSGGGQMVDPGLRRDCETKLEPPSDGVLKTMASKLSRLGRLPAPSNARDREEARTKAVREAQAEERARALAAPLDAAS